ncbi:hypothetical protein ACLQ2O_23585 [Kribbella sp. DT2]
MSEEVARTLAGLRVDSDQHAGTVELAKRYAAILDEYAGDPATTALVGPKLAAVLRQIRQDAEGQPAAQGPSRLQALRGVQAG